MIPPLPRPAVLLAVLLAVLVSSDPSHALPDRITRSNAAFPDGPKREFRECGTVVTPEEAAAYLRWREERGPVDRGIAAPPYDIPIKAHVIRRSDGTGGLPESRLDQAVLDANGHYASTGIVFFLLGDVDYIDSDEWYTTTTLAEINAMRSANPVPHAINMYFTETLDYEGGSLCGISAFTFSDVQAIALRNSCTANPDGLGNHSTFSHEIGHFFDLFHTHETAFDLEYVDGSNCGIAGDLLCDTPADPVLGSANVSTDCIYTGSAVDPHGDAYAPDPALLMSYSLKHCRDVFSPQSLDRIVDTLLSGRTDLLSGAVGAPELSAGGSPLQGARVALAAPRPNPTSRGTTLSFSLPARGVVELAIYDVRGAKVRSLARAPYSAGTHSLAWDGAGDDRRHASPGIYFARLSALGESVVKKVELLR